MKYILLACILLLVGCTQTAPSANLQKKKVRVTFYSKHEDKYGSRIACGGRATVGKTIAAERAFPFRTKVHIPLLKGVVGDGLFEVEDRGTAVERRVASNGATPVFDVYVETNQMMRKLSRSFPEYVEAFF